MIAADLKLLVDTLDAWNNGAPITPEARLRFGIDLKNAFVQVALAELGVDLNRVAVAVEAARENSNVVMLPPRPIGGAS